MGAIIGAALITASGCTSDSRIVPTPAGSSDGPKYRSKRIGLFDELIERQKTSPDRSISSLDDPGDSSSRDKPLSELQRVMAELPLEQALEAIGEPKLPTPAIGPNQASESDRKDALSRYLTGRQKLADGKFTEALDDLFAATRLDPLAPEPHRALAEANLGLGRTTAALKSFGDAAARGSTEARVYWLLGRDALKSGKAREAAELLNVARKSLVISGGDRSLNALIQSDLGDAVGAVGYLRAMVTLRQSVSYQLRDIVPPQNLRIEFGDLLRRVGEVHLSNGDALWQMGDVESASHEYSLAEESGLIDPGITMSRWFETLLRQGRTGVIADRLLSEAAEHPERIDSTRLGLLAVLARSEAADGLRAGFMQLYSKSKTPTLALILSRAVAASTRDTSEARNVLASALVSHEAEPDTIAAFLATWPVTSIAERTSAVISLVARKPTDAARWAIALAAEGHDPAILEASIRSDESTAARLLRAEMQATWGRYSDALATLEGIEESKDSQLGIGLISSRGVIAAKNGSWTVSDQCLLELNLISSLEATLATTEIERAMQRHSAAWSRLERLAGPKPEVSTDDLGKMSVLLRGAELAARLGKGDAATALLGRAVAADPHDERAYSGLVAIASAAKQVDQQKVAAILRELRQNCPNGRGARGLNFQQLLGSGLSSPSAIERAMKIVKASPQDGGIVDQLAGFAERNSAAQPTISAEAETVLSGLLAERPGATVVRRGLARVLAVRGKPDEAILTLNQTPDRIADVQSLRLKEKILKDNLKKDAESQSVEAVRMSLTQPGIDPAIEVSDWLWRAGKFDEAVMCLSSRIAPGAELDIEQQAKLLFMASRAMATLSRLPEEPRQGVSDEGKRALLIFDLVALHAGSLLPQHHQARLILLGVNAPTDFARLLAAAKFAGEQHPSLKAASLRLIADAAGNDVPRRGGEFLQYAVANTADVSASIYSLIIRRAIAFGTLEDVKKSLELAEDPAHVGGVLADLDAALEPTATTAQQQAELAYVVASGLTVSGNESRAEEIYRRALAHNPKHGLANNDLGYALLEKGEVERAAPLIEIAAEVLADRSHVLDSLGWLRYKQGRMADVAATATTPAAEGAITVLRKAIRLDNGNEAAMLDHLGDALWAAGERTQAAEVWQQAAAAAESMLREIRAVSASRESMVKELKEISATSGKKLASYRSKIEPAIAMFPGRKEPGTPLAAQDDK